MAAHIIARQLHPRGSRQWMAWLALAVLFCLFNGAQVAAHQPGGTAYNLSPGDPSALPGADRFVINSTGFSTPCRLAPPSWQLSQAVPTSVDPAGLQVDASDGRFMTINIDYMPPGSTNLSGSTCQGFPIALRPAFEAGIRMWEKVLHSDVPVTIAACYSDLQAGGPVAATTIYADYRDFSGAPQPGTCYVAAEANALAGYDLNGVENEAQITLSSRYAYYTGSDGNFNPTLYNYDLISVIGHEAGHALGFVGTMEVVKPLDLAWWDWKGRWGIDGYPNPYDRFAVDDQGRSLLNTNLFPNDSFELRDALSSNQVFFNGPQAKRANGGQPVKLYAPGLFILGSSYHHLDESFVGSANQLMIPRPTGSPWVAHEPGLIEVGMMHDIGWPELPILKPVLLAPTGAGISLKPILSWNAVPQIHYYELEISRSASFTSVDVRVLPGSASYTLNTALLPGTTYYWRVRAWRDFSAGEYSNPASFTTAQTPNPVSVITSIGPDSVTAGSGGFVLLVNGNGFISGSSVRWDGQALATTYSSSRQLQARVPGSLISSAKSVSITVYTPGPGGGTSAGHALSIKAPPTTGDCTYVQDFSFSPASPSGAQDVSVHVNIRSSYPSFRAARLSVIGREDLGSFNTFEATRSWNTRAAPDGDYTLLLEIDDTLGPAWSDPARCRRSYHLNSRPAQPTPLPLINSLSPDTVNAGSAGVTLHVYGANFQSNSVIRWDGSPISTTYYGANELGAYLPSDQVTRSNFVSISVETPGAGTSNSVTFQVIQSAPIQLIEPINGDVRVPGTSITFKWEPDGSVNYTFKIWRDGVLILDTGEYSDTFLSITLVNESVYTWQVTSTDPAANSGTPWTLTIRKPDPPQPILTSLYPSWVESGSSPFTLKVNGTGFVEASHIRWNGYELPTTYIDSGSLQAQIPAGYVVDPGSASLMVYTPAPGGGDSAPLTFTITPPPDREPPVLNWIQPVSNGAIYHADNEILDLVVDCYDLIGLQRVELYHWDALNEVIIPIASGSGGRVFKQLDTSTLNLGWNQIFARGEDDAHNVAIEYFWIYRSEKRLAPQLASLSPKTLSTSSSGSWISIYGSNFTVDSLAWMDGVELMTDYQTTSSLLAWIPAEMLGQAGELAVEVSTPGPDAQFSNTQSLSIIASGQCSPAFQLYTGSYDTFFNDGAGSTDQIDEYAGIPWSESGPEYAYSYTPQVNGQVMIRLTDMAASIDLDLFLLDGTSGVCSANQVIAYHNQTITTYVEAGHNYFIVVDGFEDSMGTYTIQIKGVQPKPVLWDITPGVVSTSAPLLSVYGSSFTPDSIVLVNGVVLKTYFISDTQLMARLPIDFPYLPGDYNLIVANPQPGGGNSDPLNLRVALGNFPLWIPAALNENR